MNLSTATVPLNTGARIPLFGIGTWKMSQQEAETSVAAALDLGYRHIDTAALYKNEEGVGRAIRASRIPREQIFLTTKLWNDDIRAGYDACLKAFDTSLRKLNLDYVDLYLIHWPVKGKYLDAWRAMETIFASGRAKAVGVSNFLVHHLQDLAKHSKLVPANNQVELHPRLLQKPLLDYDRQHGITHTAWSPLMQGKVDSVPELQAIANAHGKSPAQVALRWNIQHNIITIPKSTRPERLKSNAELFDFELSSQEMATIDALDRNERLGPDPDNFSF